MQNEDRSEQHLPHIEFEEFLRATAAGLTEVDRSIKHLGNEAEHWRLSDNYLAQYLNVSQRLAETPNPGRLQRGYRDTQELRKTLERDQELAWQRVEQHARPADKTDVLDRKAVQERLEESELNLELLEAERGDLLQGLKAVQPLDLPPWMSRMTGTLPELQSLPEDNRESAEHDLITAAVVSTRRHTLEAHYQKQYEAALTGWVQRLAPVCELRRKVSATSEQFALDRSAIEGLSPRQFLDAVETVAIALDGRRDAFDPQELVQLVGHGGQIEDVPLPYLIELAEPHNSPPRLSPKALPSEVVSTISEGAGIARYCRQEDRRLSTRAVANAAVGRSLQQLRSTEAAQRQFSVILPLIAADSAREPLDTALFTETVLGLRTRFAVDDDTFVLGNYAFNGSVRETINALDEAFGSGVRSSAGRDRWKNDVSTLFAPEIAARIRATAHIEAEHASLVQGAPRSGGVVSGPSLGH